VIEGQAEGLVSAVPCHIDRYVGLPRTGDRKSRGTDVEGSNNLDYETSLHHKISINNTYMFLEDDGVMLEFLHQGWLHPSIQEGCDNMVEYPSVIEGLANANYI
jgi:hypothetical protein